MTLLWSVFTRHNIRTITTKNPQKKERKRIIFFSSARLRLGPQFVYPAALDATCFFMPTHFTTARFLRNPPFFLKNIQSYDLIIIVNQHLKKLGFLLSTYTYLTKPIFCLFLPTPSFNLEKLYPSHLVCDQRGGGVICKWCQK